jgi:predicted DCC family thiol-disulfide oxidoreductase YuxK
VVNPPPDPQRMPATLDRVTGTSPTATLVYDGDCGFCTTSVRFVERRLATPARIVAWQDADLAALSITQADAERAVQWVAVDGRISSGSAAVGRLLLDSGGGWRLLGRLIITPPLSWVAELVYRLVSANRSRLPGGTPACSLPADRRPGAQRDSGGQRDGDTVRGDAHRGDAAQRG